MKPKEQAQQQYTEAVSRGQSAGIVRYIDQGISFLPCYIKAFFMLHFGEEPCVSSLKMLLFSQQYLKSRLLHVRAPKPCLPTSFPIAMTKGCSIRAIMVGLNDIIENVTHYFEILSPYFE